MDKDNQVVNYRQNSCKIFNMIEFVKYRRGTYLQGKISKLQGWEITTYEYLYRLAVINIKTERNARLDSWFHLLDWLDWLGWLGLLGWFGQL